MPEVKYVLNEYKIVYMDISDSGLSAALVGKKIVKKYCILMYFMLKIDCRIVLRTWFVLWNE